MMPEENSSEVLEKGKNKDYVKEKNEINITKYSMPNVKTDLIYKEMPLIDDFYRYINKPFYLLIHGVITQNRL